jgi:methylenetetrahydrofolate dehydrogenase (NADP+)/methenyltetrahydrofolate cyclohydrolase
MTASLLDGKRVAADIRQAIKHDVTLRAQLGLRPPGLAVILLGDDAASCIYVNSKRKTCVELGFQSFAYNLPYETSEHALLTLIDTLNQRDDVDGILVQLPLPPHIQEQTIIESIRPTKDVDGFHPINFGKLAQGNPGLRPCTPYGIIQLLNYYSIPLAGAHAVVVGSSNIVGRPMALELLLAKATVTVCHSSTKNLERHVRMADLLVVATGVKNVIQTEWLNKNQTVVDVGTHRLPNGSSCGDIDFQAAVNQVAWITPVPGGVGPMTICTLLQNTLFAANHYS